MTKTSQLLLALLASTTLSQGRAAKTFGPYEPTLKPLDDLAGTPGRWVAYNTGTTVQGQGEVLSFDATNSDADFRIFDFGGKSCKMRSFIGGKFYGFETTVKSQSYCSQTIISKIDEKGQVLYIDPFGGSFSYTLNDFSYSAVGNIKGGTTISGVTVPGVDIALSKTVTSSQQLHDSFRLYSKASNKNGQYPEYFYKLVSNASTNGFIYSGSNTLTLEKTEWQFKNTDTSVVFDRVDAVNFAPVQARTAAAYEGQFIFGLYFGQASCLFGVVDTYRFFKGKNSFAQMYAGPNLSQDFSCGRQSDYQGIVVEGGRPAYSYQISSTSGNIQVCTNLPDSLSQITSTADFGKVCGNVRIGLLALGQDEYYTDVNIIQANGVFLAVVNIKRKSAGTSLRQVFVDFGYGNGLPTFDTNTYFYTVSGGKIWRIKRVFKKGQQVQIGYFIPAPGVDITESD